MASLYIRRLIFNVDEDVYDLIYESIEVRLKEEEEMREYLIEDRFGKKNETKYIIKKHYKNKYAFVWKKNWNTRNTDYLLLSFSITR
jgi:hypothetical protein